MGGMVCAHAHCVWVARPVCVTGWAGDVLAVPNPLAFLQSMTHSDEYKPMGMSSTRVGSRAVRSAPCDCAPTLVRTWAARAVRSGSM